MSIPPIPAPPGNEHGGPGGTPSPKVAILLCTCNGQRHLAEQMNSIAAQAHACWEVHASDDRSTDETRAILEKYRQAWGEDRLRIYDGPGKGAPANFISLIVRVSIRGDYYAYADQDDLWMPDKLARAVAWLKNVPESTPALYCTRTRLIDENGKILGCSRLRAKPPGFANALVQNIAGGNTMVFNTAAHALLQEFGENADVTMHDWWTYLAISGCGGMVHYDAHPSVDYRQHGENLVGSGTGWIPSWRRALQLFDGEQRSWNERNVRALQHLRDRLTPANRRILDEFSAARDRRLLPRMRGLLRSGVYKQSSMDTLGMIAATMIGKF